MKFFDGTLSFSVGVAACLAIGLTSDLSAQGVTQDLLLHPARDSWPAYHGDYSGRRHSNLTQITPQNVRELALSWLYQTGQNNALKCTPAAGRRDTVYHRA